MIASRSSIRLFDTHAHFFTDDIARYPIDTRFAREGAEVLRARVMATPETVETMLARWDANHVVGGAAVQFNNVYKTDNSYTLDIADTHRARISAVLILDATDPETPDRLRALVGSRNVSGLRLVGHRSEDGAFPWLDSPAALKVWETAAELGIAMVLMYRPPDIFADALPRIAALARQFPSVPIVLDHCGFPQRTTPADDGLTPAHRALAALPNIYLKITTITLDRFHDEGNSNADFVRRLIEVFGSGRVIWGSDVGNSKPSYAGMVEMAIAATANLDELERDRLLYGNGKSIFDRSVQDARA